VGVRRQARQITFFLNGAPYPADLNSAVSPSTNYSPVKIGITDDNSNQFVGKIDELELWGRALNDYEVKDVYLNGASKNLSYSSGSFNAGYTPQVIGAIYYKVYASKTGYQRGISSQSFVSSEHATIGIPFAPVSMDVNSTATAGIAFKCNNSAFCANSVITGADVNLVIRNNGSIFRNTASIDYNSFSSRYEYSGFTPTSYGTYRLDFNSYKYKYALDQNTISVLVKKIDANKSLHSLHAAPNEVLSNSAFGISGTLVILPDNIPDYNALVTATINGTPFTAYSNASGSFDISLTAPGIRGTHVITLTATDSNGFSYTNTDLNVFVRSQTTAITMAGNVYKTGSSPQAQTAKPDENVTVTFTAMPVSERAHDMNVSLLFSDWNYGSDTNVSPLKFNYSVTDVNVVNSGQFTFNVPKKEGGGYKTITIRAIWRDENGNIGLQDYNLAQGFGDRNVLFVAERKGISITGSLDRNALSIDSNGILHYVLTPEYNAPTVLNYYRADVYDSNGSLISTVNNYATPQVVQVGQSISVDANFNSGVLTGAKYVRIKANYYDEFSNIQNKTLDLNFTTAKILIELNLNKTKYNLSDSIGVSGRLSTIDFPFYGRFDLNILNYLGTSVDYYSFSGVTVTSSVPYDFSHTFAAAGRGTFTVKGSFYDGNTGLLIESASATFIQGVVGISINSIPPRTYINSLIDVNVHVSGVNGDNNSLVASDFNVWDQNGSNYPILNFSNQANGDYFFRIKMPNSNGSYTLTFQVTETVSGLSSVSYVQATLEVLNHSYSVDVSLGANYQDYNFYVPGYVDKSISSVSSQSISVYPSNLKYYSAYSKTDGNLFGVVSTSNAPFLDITAVSGSNFQATYIQLNSTGQNYFYFILTKGGQGTVGGRQTEIQNDTFLNRVSPAFGFGSPDYQTVTAGLDYNNSAISIVSDLNINGGGDYKFVIRNTGRDGNRTKISVSTA